MTISLVQERKCGTMESSILRISRDSQKFSKIPEFDAFSFGENTRYAEVHKSLNSGISN